MEEKLKVCGPVQSMLIEQKKVNAIAIEILTKKSNAIVIMHYFCEKSNAIVEVIIIRLFKKFSKFKNIDLLIIYLLFILSGKWFLNF